MSSFHYLVNYSPHCQTYTASNVDKVGILDILKNAYTWFAASPVDTMKLRWISDPVSLSARWIEW